MTARAALSILSRPLAPGEESDQHELNRFEAIAVIAQELGLRDEATAARSLVQTLIARDERQLRLFRLLNAGTEPEGGHNGGDGK